VSAEEGRGGGGKRPVESMSSSTLRKQTLIAGTVLRRNHYRKAPTSTARMQRSLQKGKSVTPEEKRTKNARRKIIKEKGGETEQKITLQEWEPYVGGNPSLSHSEIQRRAMRQEERELARPEKKLVRERSARKP